MAGRTIDWEGMAKLLVSDDAHREFFTLRRSFDMVNTQLATKFSEANSNAREGQVIVYNLVEAIKLPKNSCLESSLKGSHMDL